MTIETLSDLVLAWSLFEHAEARSIIMPINPIIKSDLVILDLIFFNICFSIQKKHLNQKIIQQFFSDLKLE